MAVIVICDPATAVVLLLLCCCLVSLPLFRPPHPPLVVAVVVVLVLTIILFQIAAKRIKTMNEQNGTSLPTDAKLPHAPTVYTAAVTTIAMCATSSKEDDVES